MSSMVAIAPTMLIARHRAPAGRIITKLVVEGMLKTTGDTEPAEGRNPSGKSAQMRQSAPLSCRKCNALHPDRCLAGPPRPVGCMRGLGRAAEGLGGRVTDPLVGRRPRHPNRCPSRHLRHRRGPRSA